MLRVVNITFILFLLLFSTSVSARVVTGKIVDMVSWNDGHTVIAIENGPINGCSGQYYYSLGVKGQDVKAEPMLSIALAAYMASRTVTIQTADGDCQGGEEKIVSIHLTP